MLHINVPTMDQFARLSDTRADACVSIYLPTTPLSQQAGASRIELGNLFKLAHAQLSAAGFDKRRLAAIEEHVADLIDDDAFWQHQSNSLAVLVTADHVDTFRLPSRLLPIAEVSGRFHLKPLLRAVTFPHTAFILALAESGVRLIEIFAEGPPAVVKVDDLPRDAASAAGKASINDRSPSGRIHGSEGKKVRLTQYARKVDAALKPVTESRRIPLILAGNEPLLSIYRGLSSSVGLMAATIKGNPDETTDAELAAAARRILDEHYAEMIRAFRDLYAVRADSRRATADISDAARAASHGAIDTLLVDIDSVVYGTYDEETGRITLAEAASAGTYGVVDAIAARALATGAKVLGVRAADLPAGGHLAAILRYAA
jgi:hypothetical protein